jgi:hypothetical protein
MRGTLTIEGSWPAEKLRRVIVRFDGIEPTNVDGSARIVLHDVQYGRPTSFAAGTMPIGMYRVTVVPFGYQDHVRLTDSAGVDVVIGDAMPITVQLAGDEGEVIQAAELLWRQVQGPGVRVGGGRMESASYLPMDQSFKLDAPAGFIRLLVRSEGFRQCGRNVIEVEPGGTYTIRMSRAGILVVRVHAGKDPVDSGIEARMKGEPSGRTRWPHEGLTKFSDLEPGSYDIYLDEVPDGYADPGGKKVEVRAGETVELDIKLAPVGR